MKLLHFILVVILILFTLPVQITIYIGILIFSGFPVIFTQKRIGLNGKQFVMFKFRTMRNGAEKLQSKYAPLNEVRGPVFKIHNDPRFTRMGKFLSHCGLDELPQLFNVLKGDMSLIGPRPLPVSEAAKLSPQAQKRQKIKPGIISPWILNGYHSQAFTSWMKSDIEYLDHKKFTYDLQLFLKSFWLLCQLFVKETFILCFYIGLFLFLFQAPVTQAVYDPLSVPNNQFGVHILDTQETADAAKLVNSSGGDWGYVTIPIRSDDRDKEKWFNFFTNCRRLHLIPIVRLATFIDGDKWVAPTSYDLVDFANFLEPMPWPTGNRYIILFNEPNHSQEWGGQVSPLEYATLILDAKRIFKQRSDDFFLLTAGLDMSAPDNQTSMDALKFYRQMTSLQPGWYQAVDGLSVHAYPNPGFSSSVFSRTRFGISSYTYEENLLKNYGFTGKPIFITETGYIGRDDFYTPAFTQIWTESNIVAVTPFILFAGAGDFTKFSLLDLSHAPGTSYMNIEKLPKIAGSPLLNIQLPPLVEPIPSVSVSSPSGIPIPDTNPTPTSIPARLSLLSRLINFLSHPKSPTLKIGTANISIEIANTSSTRARGLSYRPSLPKDQGMLFVLDAPETVSFWMNEMRFPLDLIWISRGRVVQLTDDVPPPAQTDGVPVTVNSNQIVDRVVEVGAGFIKAHQINIGDIVE